MICLKIKIPKAFLTKPKDDNRFCLNIHQDDRAVRYRLESFLKQYADCEFRIEINVTDDEIFRKINQMRYKREETRAALDDIEGRLENFELIARKRGLDITEEPVVPGLPPSGAC